MFLRESESGAAGRPGNSLSEDLEARESTLWTYEDSKQCGWSEKRGWGWRDSQVGVPRNTAGVQTLLHPLPLPGQSCFAMNPRRYWL